MTRPRLPHSLSDWLRESERPHTIILGGLLLALFAAIWLPHLRSGLWIDESATAWLARSDFRHAVDRATRFEGQSPMYFVLVWACSRVFGTAEWALRIPSVFLVIGSLVILYRIARRDFDRETGLLACVIFACHVSQYGLEARPYGLGLFAVTGAWLFLNRWLDHHRTGDALAYIFFAALIFYAHFIFAVTYLLHLALLWTRTPRGKAVPMWSVLAVGAAIATLIAPAVPQLLALHRRKESLAYLATPRQPELAVALFPMTLVMAVLVGVLLAHLLRRRPTFSRAPNEGRALWMAVWHAFPILALFALSRVGFSNIFANRYYASGAPGLALFAAWLVRGIDSGRVRVLTAALFVTLSAATSLPIVPWRDVVALVRLTTGGEQVPILVPPVFVEAKQVSWLTDPEKREYLLAPARYYGMPGDLIPLPLSLTDESKAYLSQVIAAQLAHCGKFLWIAGSEDSTLEQWLDDRLLQRGDRRTTLHAGGFAIHVFDRRQGSQSR